MLRRIFYYIMCDNDDYDNVAKLKIDGSEADCMPVYDQVGSNVLNVLRADQCNKLDPE